MEKVVEINLDYCQKSKGYPQNCFILSSRALGSEDPPVVIYPALSNKESGAVFGFLEKIFGLSGCLNKNFKCHISDSAKRGLGEENTKKLEQKIDLKNREMELIRKFNERSSSS